jgi:hypothetical protein
MCYICTVIRLKKVQLFDITDQTLLQEKARLSGELCYVYLMEEFCCVRG